MHRKLVFLLWCAHILHLSIVRAGVTWWRGCLSVYTLRPLLRGQGRSYRGRGDLLSSWRASTGLLPTSDVNTNTRANTMGRKNYWRCFTDITTAGKQCGMRSSRPGVVFPDVLGDYTWAGMVTWQVMFLWVLSRKFCGRLLICQWYQQSRSDVGRHFLINKVGGLFEQIFILGN